MTSLTLICVLLAAGIQGCLGDAWVQMRFMLFRHTSGTLHSGGPCDNIPNDGCDTFFEICVSAIGSSQCEYGLQTTGIFSGVGQLIDMTEMSTLPDRDDVENPLRISVPVSTSSFTIQITAYDSDIGARQLINRFTVNSNTFVPGRSADTTEYATAEFSRINVRSSLDVQVRVYCGQFFVGPTCEIQCLPPFPARQVCTDDGQFECTAQFFGANCERPNPCQSFPCKNSGTCLPDPSGDSYTCECVMGYTGFDCNSGIDECASDPCQNGATCVDQINAYQCICLFGYTGNQCETVTNPCEDNPCRNGGICTFTAPGDFECDCRGTGFDGLICQNPINSCNPNPCLNGGSCSTPSPGTYECDCTGTGFTGTNCEIDRCIPNPCANFGTCTRLGNGFRCNCPLEFTGPTCLTPVTACGVGTCRNGGTCRELGGTNFRCDCVPGWTGVRCDVDINECLPQPCFNNGVCNNLLNRYTCNCVGLWTGPQCRIPICTTGFCLNGGTCRAFLGGLRCDCPTGWTGQRCETVDDGSGPFECRERQGFFADVTDCSYFYFCANWIAYRVPCGPLLEFSPQWKYCSWPSHAGCSTI